MGRLRLLVAFHERLRKDQYLANCDRRVGFDCDGSLEPLGRTTVTTRCTGSLKLYAAEAAVADRSSAYQNGLKHTFRLSHRILTTHRHFQAL